MEIARLCMELCAELKVWSYVRSLKQQPMISYQQTRHVIGGVILCETKEQTQDIYGLIRLSIKPSQVLPLTYAYQLKDSRKKKKRQKFSLTIRCAYTMEDMQYKSIR